MGHKDPETTLRIYTHYVKSNGVKAAGAITALMDSLPTTNIVPIDEDVKGARYEADAEKANEEEADQEGSEESRGTTNQKRGSKTKPDLAKLPKAV